MFTLGDVSDILDTALDTGLDIVDALNKLSDCADEGRLSRERCFERLNLSGDPIAEETSTATVSSDHKHVSCERAFSSSNYSIEESCSTKEFVYSSTSEQSQQRRSTNSISHFNCDNSTLNTESVVHLESNNRSCREHQTLLLKENQTFVDGFPGHGEILSRPSPSHDISETMSGTCTTMQDGHVNNKISNYTESPWIKNKPLRKLEIMSLAKREELRHSTNGNVSEQSTSADVFSLKDVHDSDILDALGELCRVADEIMKKDITGFNDKSSGLRLESINEQVDGSSYLSSFDEDITAEEKIELKDTITTSIMHNGYLNLPQLNKKVLSLPSVVDVDNDYVLSQPTIIDDNVMDKYKINEQPDTFGLRKWDNIASLTVVDINVNDKETDHDNTNDIDNCKEQTVNLRNKQNGQIRPTTYVIPESPDEAMPVQDSPSRSGLSEPILGHNKIRPGTYKLEPQLSAPSLQQSTALCDKVNNKEIRPGTYVLDKSRSRSDPNDRKAEMNLSRPDTYILSKPSKTTPQEGASVESQRPDTFVILPRKTSNPALYLDKSEEDSKLAKYENLGETSELETRKRPGTFVIDSGTRSPTRKAKKAFDFISNTSSSKEPLAGHRQSKPDTFVMNSSKKRAESEQYFSKSNDHLSVEQIMDMPDTLTGIDCPDVALKKLKDMQENNHNLPDNHETTIGSHKGRPGTFVIEKRPNSEPSASMSKSGFERRQKLSESDDLSTGRTKSRPDTFVIEKKSNHESSSSIFQAEPDRSRKSSDTNEPLIDRPRSRPDTFVIENNSDFKPSLNVSKGGLDRRRKSSESDDGLIGRRKSRPSTFVIDGDSNVSTIIPKDMLQSRRKSSDSDDGMIGRRRSRPDTFVISPRRASAEAIDAKVYHGIHRLENTPHLVNSLLSPQSPRIKQTTSEQCLPSRSKDFFSKTDSNAELGRIEESQPLKTFGRAVSFDQWTLPANHLGTYSLSLTSNTLSDNMNSLASISSESWSNSFRVPYSPSFDGQSGYVTSSTFSDDIGVSQIFGCSRTQSELSLQPMKHERTQSYEDISPSKSSFASTLSTNQNLSASMPNVSFLESSIKTPVSNEPQPIQDGKATSYIVTKPTFDPNVMEDVAEKLGSLYDYMSMSLSRLHEIQRCQKTEVHIYSDDVIQDMKCTRHETADNPSTPDKISQAAKMLSMKPTSAYRNNYNKPGFPDRTDGFDESPFQLKRTGTYVVDGNKTSTPTNAVPKKTILQANNIDKKTFNISKVKSTTPTSTASKNEKNRQPLTARLKMLKMKLEERRKHIETEKKKMESQWNEEMAKVGQTAFWFAIGNETKEDNAESKDVVDHPEKQQNSGQVKMLGDESTLKTPLRSSTITPNVKQKSKSPAWEISLDSPSETTTTADTEDSEDLNDKPVKPQGLMFVPLDGASQNQDSSDVDSSTSKRRSPPMECSTPVCLSESYGHLLNKPNNVIDTEQTISKTSDVDDMSSNIIGSSTPLLTTETMFSPDKLQAGKDTRESKTSSVNNDLIGKDKNDESESQEVDTNGLENESMLLNEQPRQDRKLWANQNEPLIPKVSSSFVPQTGNSISDIQNVERQANVESRTPNVMEFTTLDADSPEKQDLDSTKYQPVDVCKTLFCGDESIQNQESCVIIDNTPKPVVMSKDTVEPYSPASLASNLKDLNLETSLIHDQLSHIKEAVQLKPEIQQPNINNTISQPNQSITEQLASQQSARSQSSKAEHVSIETQLSEQLQTLPNQSQENQSQPSINAQLLKQNQPTNTVDMSLIQKSSPANQLSNVRKTLFTDLPSPSSHSNTQSIDMLTNQLSALATNDQPQLDKPTYDSTTQQMIEQGKSSLNNMTKSSTADNQSLPKPVGFEISLDVNDLPQATSDLNSRTRPTTAVNHTRQSQSDIPTIDSDQSQNMTAVNGLPQDASPNAKGAVLIIGDGENADLGLTPEQIKKRERFLKNRQKRQEEERAKREAASAKKAKKEMKQKSQSLNVDKSKPPLQPSENHMLMKPNSEESVARTEQPNFHPVTQRPFAAPVTQQPFNSNNQSLAQRLAADLSSTQSAAQSQFSEYKGPSAYVKPSGKSNRKIMNNAISHCCLSGEVNRSVKEKCLQELAKSDAVHFLVLFREGLKFRSLYSYAPDTEQVTKIYGIGPKHIVKKMIEKLYKYNSGAKEFTYISARSLSIQVDGLTIKKEYWQSAKASSKADSTAKRQPLLHIK